MPCFIISRQLQAVVQYHIVSNMSKRPREEDGETGGGSPKKAASSAALSVSASTLTPDRIILGGIWIGPTEMGGRKWDKEVARDCVLACLEAKLSTSDIALLFAQPAECVIRFQFQSQLVRQ